MQFDVTCYKERPAEGNELRSEAETAVYDFLDRLGIE